MTRPPAFQFYAADFMYGCRTLTLAERGAYITLLCHQWDKGSVPGDDLDTLALVLGTSGFSARKLWGKLADKFPYQNARYCNTRLEIERVKQTRFRQKMAQNGQKGGRPPKKPQVIDRLLKTKAEKSSSSPSSVRTTPLPPSRRGRRHISPTVQAEAEQIRKTQEVKRLVHTEGLTFVEASRRVGFT